MRQVSLYRLWQFYFRLDLVVIEIQSHFYGPLNSQSL